MTCIRLRPEHRNHVWSYDFVHCRTDDGNAFRTLNVIDEFSRECLAIREYHELNSSSVIDALSDLFILREAQILIEEWRKHENTRRPHSALGYRTPAPETNVSIDQRSVRHQQSDQTTQVGLISALIETCRTLSI